VLRSLGPISRRCVEFHRSVDTGTFAPSQSPQRFFLSGGVLVGVEFILDSASWLAANNNTSPVLDGQVFNFVGFPNRFSINSFFELHVWAWRDNPQGAFVDWNNGVSCQGQ
jgi:hypothetical protein